MNVIDLIVFDREKVNLDEIFLNDKNKNDLVQLLKEFSYIDELKKYNLPLNNKILLHGHSGCGKTMTAKAIATQLNRPLLILDLNSFVSSRIGETAKNISLIFEKAEREKAVLFLDEFDHLGKMRGNDDQDVGEMRRLVNALIQLIDKLSDRTLLVAATNHIKIIDTALLRRFQLKIGYEMPDKKTLDQYYKALFANFPMEFTNFELLYNISFAEAKDYCYTQIKAKIINQLEQ
ncbi:MAG: AAA family ATPase [Bacteroidetes bacterium]|jgi:SpoVK/Ycf46/Vps4 family AAA+-type ATPase|nr:AAA family ATPase [Bacteroidota bacterium]